MGKKRREKGFFSNLFGGKENADPQAEARQRAAESGKQGFNKRKALLKRQEGFAEEMGKLASELEANVAPKAQRSEEGFRKASDQLSGVTEGFLRGTAHLGSDSEKVDELMGSLTAADRAERQVQQMDLDAAALKAVTLGPDAPTRKLSTERRIPAGGRGAAAQGPASGAERPVRSASPSTAGRLAAEEDQSREKAIGLDVEDEFVAWQDDADTEKLREELAAPERQVPTSAPGSQKQAATPVSPAAVAAASPIAAPAAATPAASPTSAAATPAQPTRPASPPQRQPSAASEPSAPASSSTKPVSELESLKGERTSLLQAWRAEKNAGKKQALLGRIRRKSLQIKNFETRAARENSSQQREGLVASAKATIGAAKQRSGQETQRSAAAAPAAPPRATATSPVAPAAAAASTVASRATTPSPVIPAAAPVAAQRVPAPAPAAASRQPATLPELKEKRGALIAKIQAEKKIIKEKMGGVLGLSMQTSEAAKLEFELKLLNDQIAVHEKALAAKTAPQAPASGAAAASRPTASASQTPDSDRAPLYPKIKPESRGNGPYEVQRWASLGSGKVQGVINAVANEAVKAHLQKFTKQFQTSGKTIDQVVNDAAKGVPDAEKESYKVALRMQLEEIQGAVDDQSQSSPSGRRP